DGAQLRVKALEQETAHVALWRAELAVQRAELDAGTEQIVAIEGERAQAAQRRDALLRLKTQIDQLAAERTQAENTWRVAAQALELARRDLEEAQEARRIVEERAADHQSCLSAQTALQTAYAQQGHQKGLLGQQAAHQQDRATALVRAQHAEDQAG